MKSAAISRLESALQGRKLDGTLTPFGPGATPDSHVARLASGIAAIDDALGGGWRRGEVSEIVGPRSSGRTSLLLATLAAATRRGDIVAVIDVVDRFDPGDAAAIGVDLDRMLWVRGPALTVELQSRPRASGLRPQADMLHTVVQRGVRAFDLILRAGGFGVVALDVSDVPQSVLRSMPWTTWMRLAHANEGRATVALLVGESRLGKSARGASIQLASPRRWSGASPQSRRFAGFSIRPAS